MGGWVGGTYRSVSYPTPFSFSSSFFVVGELGGVAEESHKEEVVETYGWVGG